MFREMRRNRQMLPMEETLELLKKGTSGVLALLGDEDYPYAVPVSYVYADEKLYFHGARSGHKLDAIRKQDKASFCVISQDRIMPEEYTTYFRSVIAFGRIRILEDEAEMRRAIEILAEKYSPDVSEAGRRQEIDKTWNALCMLEFTIEHVTGKEAIGLARGRK